jgi:hypothetical protein
MLMHGSFDAFDNNYGRKGVPIKLLEIRNHDIVYFVFTSSGSSIKFVIEMCKPMNCIICVREGERKGNFSE